MVLVVLVVPWLGCSLWLACWPELVVPWLGHCLIQYCWSNVSLGLSFLNFTYSPSENYFSDEWKTSLYKPSYLALFSAISGQLAAKKKKNPHLFPCKLKFILTSLLSHFFPEAQDLSQHFYSTSMREWLAQSQLMSSKLKWIESSQSCTLTTPSHWYKPDYVFFSLLKWVELLYS